MWGQRCIEYDLPRRMSGALRKHERGLGWGWQNGSERLLLVADAAGCPQAKRREPPPLPISGGRGNPLNMGAEKPL